MTPDDNDCMIRIILDLQVRRAACRILGISEDAEKNDLKRAYRKASMKYHPDHNKDDPDANKKFALVKCAYELLAEHKSCPKLLEQINIWQGVPQDDEYKLDNPWGHFLWWREKFFGSEEKPQSHKRTSCI